MADGLRARLLHWYRAERRDLPWRRDADPYRVWISEVMLQQTTVVAVAPYFERWMEKFPDVRALARARERDVLAAWQGLGYYCRAKNAHAAAKRIVRDGFPVSFRKWMDLPGVGRYTAGAIASIAHGERVPAVDGNVQRVYARVCADAEPGARARAEAWAARLADCPAPGDLNQALMELGATVCRPVSPLCPRCPIAKACASATSGLASEYPPKKRNAEVVPVRREIEVAVFGTRVAVEEIKEGRWWQGMWGFAATTARATKTCGLGEFRATVTKHRLTLAVSLKVCASREPGVRWVTWRELERLPLPSPHRRIALRAQEELQGIGSKATGTAKVPSSAKK